MINYTYITHIKIHNITKQTLKQTFFIKILFNLLITINNNNKLLLYILQFINSKYYKLRF